MQVANTLNNMACLHMKMEAAAKAVELLEVGRPGRGALRVLNISEYFRVFLNISDYF